MGVGRPRGKEMKTVTVRVSVETNELWDRFCEETGLSKTMAVEKILSHYFAEFFKKPEAERTLFGMKS